MTQNHDINGMQRIGINATHTKKKTSVYAKKVSIVSKEQHQFQHKHDYSCFYMTLATLYSNDQHANTAHT